MKPHHGHIFFLILGILIMVLVVAVYAYMQHEIGAELARAAQARNTLNANLATRDRDQSFMTVYQATASQWASLGRYFIPSSDVVTFIKSIEALSGQSGATVTLSSIGADTLDGAAPGTQGLVHAKVSAIGSWSSVMRTLSLAEVLPYKVAINNVSLAATSQSGPALSAGEKLAGSVATGQSWSLSFDLTATMLVPYAATTSP